MTGLMRRRAIVAAFCLTAGGCGGDSPTGPSPTPPAIGLSTRQVAFAAPQGGASPGPQTVAVQDSGTQTLTGLAIGPITYTGTSGWLSASLDATTPPATLTLSVTTGSLTSGSYAANVPISASAASNSPQSIAVTFLVLSGGGTTTLAAAGQSVVFLDGPSLGTKLTLQSGSRYLIAVVNTAPTPTVTEDFRLVGALLSGATASVAALPAAAPPSLSPRYTEPPAPRGGTYALREPGMPSSVVLRQLAQNHLAMLDWNRRIYSRLGNPSTVRARLRAAGRIAPLSAAVTPTVGAVNQVYVRKALGGDCATVDSINARTVAVGQHIIVLADTNRTNWPQSQRPDTSFYPTFANEYDQITWPHIQNQIGDPLAYDANLSGLGKVTVTITPVLNGIGSGIVAFVNGCDFFPFTSSGPDPNFSNNTEMFYSLVPAPNGFTVTNWEKELRATAAHETKHLVSFTDRIINQSNAFEQIWLEEGLAQESSEIWMRQFNQATWKAHANFLQTVGCELNLGANAPCDAQNDKPLDLVVSHLPFLFQYLQKESQSNAEGLGLDFASDYGAGWAIARWATDQYASDEGGFIKSLVNEPALTGLDNLSAHTGQPIPLLLMYWNLASAIYTTPTYTAADPRITIPSFNLADIFNVGQTQLTCNGTPCGLFTDSGKPIFPVQPIALSAGAIGQTVQGVPGTAAAFFLLTASKTGTEALQLQSGSGGTLSPSSALRVGIIRVH